MPIEKLLFIDTNIWLDFYRSHDTALKLLDHVEAIKDKVIVTYQVESEFKTNRQRVLKQVWVNLKPAADVERPNILADAKTAAMLAKNIKDANGRVTSLRKRLEKVLAKPTVHDPVYKACQRIFHRDSDIVLKRDNPLRHQMRRRAYKRFLHGCPPRKVDDTSMGDGFNWEWMIHCAIEKQAELVIVSRDADYGVILEKEAYINDHLRQEFQERVSKKRKIVLYTRLSEALKRHFKVHVTEKEAAAETEMVDASKPTGIGQLMQGIGGERSYEEMLRAYLAIRPGWKTLQELAGKR